MAESLPSAGSTVDYTQPGYYTGVGQNLAGGINDLLGNQGYINDTMNNWYDAAPGQGALGQYATWNQNQQNAMSDPFQVSWNQQQQQNMVNPQLTSWNSGQRNSMSDPYEVSWNQQQQQNMINPQLANFNSGQQQQFMNPYVKNVVNEQARLSNQNFNEQVVPGINSTFAGAGQFGSTRNADFMNRAIRDQQTQLAGQQGQTLMNAQNQAANQYTDWTKMNQQAKQFGSNQFQDIMKMNQAAQGMGGADYQNLLKMNQAGTQFGSDQFMRMLGMNQQGAQLGAGSYKDWTQMGTQAGQQDFTNWMQQANYPLSALSQVGQIFGNMRTSQPQSISTSTAGPNDMEKLTGALGILNSGLNDNTINQLLEWSGLNFNG